MDKKIRKRLESAGYRIGDAEDFLKLTVEERRLVELRRRPKKSKQAQDVVSRRPKIVP